MQEFYEGLATTSPHSSLSATQRKWLVALRDKSEVKDDDPIPAGGFYWAVNLAGPFLLGWRGNVRHSRDMVWIMLRKVS